VESFSQCDPDGEHLKWLKRTGQAYLTFQIKTIVLTFFPLDRSSFLLTSAFKGSRYTLALLSNHIAVFHSLRPIRAVAANLPHPASSSLKAALISFDNFTGNEIKCQPPGPGYFHILEEKRYWILRDGVVIENSN
jgi:hypothetical protein